MSLDVYLNANTTITANSKSRIFIREDGQNKEISSDEWEERFPSIEAITVIDSDPHKVYCRNITHNLAKMAKEAGIYKELWRPDEMEITKAKQLIEPLRKGLALLKSDPDHFKEFNPKNLWGDYEGFVDFVKEYLQACVEYPDADVRVSR